MLGSINRRGRGRYLESEWVLGDNVSMLAEVFGDLGHELGVLNKLGVQGFPQVIGDSARSFVTEQVGQHGLVLGRSVVLVDSSAGS